MKAPSSDALVPECRRCPPKWWVSLLRGNDFGGNPKEGGKQYFHDRGQGFPGGKEGEQYSHVRDVHSISHLSMLHSPSVCCMSARITPKQTGTDLNPTENTFGGDPGLTPSPLVSMRSCFGCINVHFSECFAIKTRSRGLLRACFDFNETSLSRARKFLLPAAVKIFDAIP